MAAYFFKIKETLNTPLGLFYDPEKEGVDFLIHARTGEMIPVEVSIGEKGKSQVKKAIKRYRSPHGVIISDTEKVALEEGVVSIPMTIFAFA